jgi:chitodextrinase
MEPWNFEYTHKNSSNFPWSHYGQGGPYECPYHTEHGSSYNAGLHMDRQDPNDYLAGEFNGVHMVTNKYWLLGNRDYWLNLEFRELTGPAACIEATAVFAHGDATTTQWGDCSNEPPPNNPPTASFSHACDALDCSFNGSGSSDSDGSVVAWDWDFGDGNTATGSNPDHQFASDGSYTVTLTVTDDDGDTSSMQQQLAVAEPPPPAAITVTLSTNKKANRVSVRWSGATSRKVDVYRDGGKVSTTRNDGSWNDRGVSKGNSYSYRVCEQGSAEACSEDVSITL